MDHINDAQIRALLGKGLDPQTMVQELTREALQQGSPDNVTGLLVQFF
jgi:serine/threonine protein phosphatase PrpC